MQKNKNELLRNCAKARNYTLFLKSSFFGLNSFSFSTRTIIVSRFFSGGRVKAVYSSILLFKLLSIIYNSLSKPRRLFLDDQVLSSPIPRSVRYHTQALFIRANRWRLCTPFPIFRVGRVSNGIASNHSLLVKRKKANNGREQDLKKSFNSKTKNKSLTLRKIVDNQNNEKNRCLSMTATRQETVHN